MEEEPPLLFTSPSPLPLASAAAAVLAGEGLPLSAAVDAPGCSGERGGCCGDEEFEGPAEELVSAAAEEGPPPPPLPLAAAAAASRALLAASSRASLSLPISGTAPDGSRRTSGVACWPTLRRARAAASAPNHRAPAVDAACPAALGQENA